MYLGELNKSKFSLRIYYVHKLQTKIVKQKTFKHHYPNTRHEGDNLLQIKFGLILNLRKIKIFSTM